MHISKYFFVIFLVSSSFLVSNSMWELVDNNTEVPRRNGKLTTFHTYESALIGNKIFFLDHTGHPKVIESDDYCLNWDTTIQSHVDELLTPTQFYTLVENNNKLFVCGDNGRLYRSFDSGETWDYHYFGDNDNHPIQHLKFLDENIGFAGLLYENLLAKTTDGGNTWTPLPDLPSTIPNSFAFLNFILKDENNIIAILKAQTENIFIETTNGGNDWNVIDALELEETQFSTQEYDRLIYNEPYIYVSSEFKESNLGHNRIMRTTDFKSWEHAFISDTISGGKLIWNFSIYDNVMFGFGSRIFVYSIDNGETWLDLYDENDQFYENNSRDLVYLNKYVYSQSSIKDTDPDGNVINIRKMFRYKLDIETSVETELTNLSVYPNPAQSEVNITYEKGLESIEVIDINGKNILRIESLNLANDKSINVESLSTGTYFIRINNKIYKRFVKE